MPHQVVANVCVCQSKRIGGRESWFVLWQARICVGCSGMVVRLPVRLLLSGGFVETLRICAGVGYAGGQDLDLHGWHFACGMFVGCS